MCDWSYDNGEKIPTLEEILLELKGKIKLFIDLKGTNKLVFEKSLILVLKYEMLEQSTFIAFCHEFFYEIEDMLALHNLSTKRDNINCGLLMESFEDKPDLSRINNKNKFILDVDMLYFLNHSETKEFVLAAASQGMKIIVYCYPITTIESEDQILSLTKYGVSGITTNDPEVLQNFYSK